VARQDPTVAIVGPKILQAQDPQRLDSMALDVNLRSGRIYLTGHDEADRGQYDHLGETLAVTGCAMLVSRTTVSGSADSTSASLRIWKMRTCASGHGLPACGSWRPARPGAPPAGAGHEARQSVASLYYTTRNHLMLMDRHGIGSRWQRCGHRMTVVGLSLAYAVRAGSGPARNRLGAVWCGVRDHRRGVVGGSWIEGSRPRLVK